jgi:DNA invertase Pin-like site-specific DNA recombinase
MNETLNAQKCAATQDCPEGAEMQKLTILYERLSREDLRADESLSIENQKKMLEIYAEQNGLVPYLHLSDDGYTGTNYNRPGWQELIAKVEADEVGTIIVKNLDRMGRNYLQTGMYREMFQERGVRLIAVNDGVDTFDRDDDFTPFREIMAEWYARDCSRKVKAVLQAKGKSGKPMTNIPPYGYAKDPNDKNKWLTDPEAAAVVRRIFKMSIDGMGPQTIAGALTREKVERPSYRIGFPKLGHNRDNDEASDYDNRYVWGSGTIVNILSRLEYLGHTVNLRTKSVNFKSKKRLGNLPEDWLIFPNTHEAIVSREDYDLVQKLRETPRRIDHLGEANPLTGILCCADCGGKLHNHRDAHPSQARKNPIDVYRCSTYLHTGRRFNTQCTAHHISTAAARTIILEAIRKTAGYVREHEAEFAEKVRELSAVRQGETAKAHKKQIAKSERRLAELDKIFRSLYEDKALEKISEEMFAEMSGGYGREREELKSKTTALQTELDAYNADSERADRFIELVRKYTEFEELTPAILNGFVDKVIVHEGVWSDGCGENGRPRGSRTQEVDVYLKYIGKFDAPDARTPEEIEAERVAEEKLEAKRAYHREKTRQYNERKKAKLAAETAPTSAAKADNKTAQTAIA